MGFQIPYKNSVLFIEDIDEYLYHIDRMIVALKYGGFFDSINALIVGSFNQMNDNSIPFGSDVKEIIRSNFKSLNVPILFDFPSGHSDENYSLKLGMYCTFESHKFTQF